MGPRLRAIADRVLFDSATVLYIASGVAPGQEDARAEPGGRTVRQVLGHLGTSLGLHADAVVRLSSGGTLVPPGWDPDRSNGSGAVADADRSLAEAVGRLSEGRRRLLVALGGLDESQGEAQIGGGTVADALETWSRHCAAHAFDLMDALPQFRADPIALNWALFLDLHDQPGLAQRQSRLFRELQDRARRAPEEV